MRFIATADLQISDRTVYGRPRLPIFKNLLDDLDLLCQRHKVRHLFLLGDVLDQKNHHPREVLLLVYRWLQTMQKRKVAVWWLRGNHESPSRTEPEESVVLLYANMCRVINRPEVTMVEDTLFTFLPWYPVETFVDESHRLALRVHEETFPGRKVLLSHVALKEGRVSEQGMKVQTKVGFADLYPEFYDMVLLGDYHAHQFLGDRVVYLGAPIPHTFGDWGIEGPWLIDTEELSMEPLCLPSTYPRFCRYEVHKLEDRLPDYDPRDYNQIRTLPSLIGKVKQCYPDADVRPLVDDVEVDLSGSRMKLSDLSNPENLCRRYLDFKLPKLSEKEKEPYLQILRELLFRR